MPTNATHRRLLTELAALLEVSGANAFRVRAYHRAARVVRALDEPVDALIDAGRLLDVDGIGSGIAGELSAFTRTGESPARAELRASLPPGVLALLSIRGLGPSKVRRLWTEHGIDSPAELSAAIADGRLAAIRGFGPKTITALLTELDRAERLAGRLPFARAVAASRRLVAALSEASPAARISIAGPVARAAELVDRLDIVATGPVADLLPALDRLAPEVDGGRCCDGVPVVVHACTAVDRGLVELGATSGAAHLAALAPLAAARGVDLADARGWGDAAATVDAVYRRLGLEPIPAPLRDDGRAVAAQREGWMPELAGRAAFRGDLHMHTTWSDGTGTVADMAGAAAARGLEYIAITDHSGSLEIANGLDAERLSEQVDAIAALDHVALGCRVLAGLEVDILPDGALDMDPSVLDRLDWVVGSVHTAFGQRRRDMTARVVRAVESGRIHALGHPTARKIGVRDGVDIDLERVLDACAANGVAVELNASPYRLDLGAADLRRALERADLWVVINTDAHSPAELANLSFGAATAQRAWVPRERVLNCLPHDAFRAEISR